MKPETALRFLLVNVQGQTFAIPSSSVVEISPAIKPTKLPFVPHYIAGLVNVKGNVIPLLNLSAYISPDQSAENRMMVVILSGDTHFALGIDSAIDEISSADINVSLYDIKPLPGDSEHVLVSGDIDFVGEKTFILDMDQFDNIIHASDVRSAGGGLLGKVSRQEQHEEEIPMLVFQALGERFGFSLDHIVEVTEVDTLIPIPGAPECVEGLAMLRDDALLVLSFPVLLGRKYGTQTSKKLLVVIEREMSFYGIDISTSVSINSFRTGNFKKSPNDKSLFSQVLLDEQNQATVVITNNELIPDELHAKLKDLAPESSSKISEVINYRSVLHITIDALSYVFPLDYVRMVSTHNTLTKVNDFSESVTGIIEIDGRILSVLDTRQHLGFVDFEKTEPEYVVIGDENSEWAIPVTHINQIIDIPETDIENIESGDVKHLSGIAHYQGQLIPVVNLRELCSSDL